MKRIRKLALGAVIWLTSAVTVAAGVPELVCRCPRSTMAAAGESDPSSVSGCRCGGGCCAGNARPCCRSAEESMTNSITEHRVETSQVGRAPSHRRLADINAQRGKCVRSLTSNSLMASDRGSRTTSPEPVSKKLAPPSPICDVRPDSANPHPTTLAREGPIYSSNDLITALRHLNI